MSAAERMRRYRKRQAKRPRAAEASAKFAAKQAKIAARARIATPLDTSTRYPVIYADPPWRFEPYSRETGMDRAADNHYGTMTLDEICAVPVRELAAGVAILYLWVTVPIGLGLRIQKSICLGQRNSRDRASGPQPA